jgi:hypothetical protein
VKRAGWFYLAALALGIVVWAAITSVSERREAWDSSLYFSVGMPLLCAGSMVLAILEPAHSWRWGVIPFAGQFLAMLAAEGVGNLRSGLWFLAYSQYRRSWPHASALSSAIGRSLGLSRDSQPLGCARGLLSGGFTV